MNTEFEYKPAWLTGGESAVVTRQVGDFCFAKVGEFFLTEDSQAVRRKVWQGYYIEWNVRLRFILRGAEKETNAVYAVTVDGEIKYVGMTRNAILNRWGLFRKQSSESPRHGCSFFIWHSDVADYAIQAALGTKQGTKENLEAPAVEYWLCTNPHKFVDDNLIKQPREIEAALIRSEQPEWNTAGK